MSSPDGAQVAILMLGADTAPGRRNMLPMRRLPRLGWCASTS